VVREDVNNAFADLIELFLKKRNFSTADELRQASKTFACDSLRIEQLFSEFGPKK